MNDPTNFIAGFVLGIICTVLFLFSGGWRTRSCARRNGTDRSVILTGLEAAPGGETDRNPKGPNQ